MAQSNFHTMFLPMLNSVYIPIEAETLQMKEGIHKD